MKTELTRRLIMNLTNENNESECNKAELWPRATTVNARFISNLALSHTTRPSQAKRIKLYLSMYLSSYLSLHMSLYVYECQIYFKVGSEARHPSVPNKTHYI